MPRKPTTNHDDRQRTINNRKNSPKRDNDRFHSDDWRKNSNHPQTVYPKRNFINRQFHLTERRITPETPIDRNEPHRLATSSINTRYQGNHREARNDPPHNSAIRQRNILAEPPTRTDQQRPIQKRNPSRRLLCPSSEWSHLFTGSFDDHEKASPKFTNIEAPKRYSTMRHGLASPSFRNGNEQSNSISVYSSQRLIFFNHADDWLQAPPSPLSSYFSQQKFPPSPSSRHHPQVSRYFPMNDSQTSLARDVSNTECAVFHLWSALSASGNLKSVEYNDERETLETEI